MLLLSGILLYFFIPREYTETGVLWLENNNSRMLYLRGTIDNLKITSWNSDKVKINYTKKINSNSKKSANKKMKNLIFDTYTLQDYTIFNPVILSNKKKSGVINQLNLYGEKPSLSLEICLPELSKFNIGITKGNVSIKNMNSESKITTENGNIVLQNLKGFYSIRTYHGDVSGDYLQGQYKIFAKKGDVKIRHIKGLVSATAPAGKIDVQHYNKIFAQK